MTAIQLGLSWHLFHHVRASPRTAHAGAKLPAAAGIEWALGHSQGEPYGTDKVLCHLPSKGKNSGRSRSTYRTQESESEDLLGLIPCVTPWEVKACNVVACTALSVIHKAAQGSKEQG